MNDELLDLAAMAAEPLHPDLEPWVEDLEWGACLRHPLVYSVPLSLPGFCNRQYEQKRLAVDRAKVERNWSQYVFLHERPYRLTAARALLAEETLTAHEQWHLLRDVWIDSENIWQHYHEWHLYLQDENAHLMMDDEEREQLVALPDVITIYRGARFDVNEEGLSWTLDRPKAAWFATRFSHREEESVVIVAEIQKNNVIALLLGRDENEIIALPEDVRILRYEEIS